MRPCSLLLATIALAAAGTASAGQVNLLNHSGYTACFAFDATIYGTDPDLGWRGSGGWDCVANGQSIGISANPSVAIAAYVVRPGGPVNYVVAHPSGFSTAQVPVPQSLDLDGKFSLTYRPDGAGGWSYTYKTGADSAYHSYTSPPNASWVPGLAPIGFQTVTGWDFLAYDILTVTINPP